MSPELQSRIAIWRQKTSDGSMSVEEYREAIAAIRGDRKNAAVTSEQSKRKKAAKVIPDAKSLLGELGGLK